MWVALLLLTRPECRMSYRKTVKAIVEESAGLLGWQRSPSIASLSVARRKVSVDDCRALFHRLTTHLWLMQRACFRHCHPRRFIAIDGVKFICPRTKETLRRLDRPKYFRWLFSHYPQALVVVAFDVIRRMPLEWALLPKGRGERAGMQPLLATLRRGDVAIMDRGFPARWLLRRLHEHGVDVVMRMTTAAVNAWPEVEQFLRSQARTAVVTCALDKGKSITVRLVRKNFRRGRPRKHQRAETMVILTTLLPRDGFEAKDIVDLYGRRWGIETLFREMKEAFSIERFHSRSLRGIEQEVAAVLAWLALSAVLQDHIEVELGDGRRAIASLCRAAVEKFLLMAWRGDDLEPSITSWLEHIRKYAYKPRPGRSFPRETKRSWGRFRKVG